MSDDQGKNGMAGAHPGAAIDDPVDDAALPGSDAREPQLRFAMTRNAHRTKGSDDSASASEVLPVFLPLCMGAIGGWRLGGRWRQLFSSPAARAAPCHAPCHAPLGVQGSRLGVGTLRLRDAAWRHGAQQLGRGGRRTVRRERVRATRHRPTAGHPSLQRCSWSR